MSGVEIGVRNGTPYKLQRARLCDVLGVNLRTVAWHLWIGDGAAEGYEGNFPTKGEAISHIDAAKAEGSV